jgi:hypothetical protein
VRGELTVCSVAHASILQSWMTGRDISWRRIGAVMWWLVVPLLGNSVRRSVLETGLATAQACDALRVVAGASVPAA